MSDIDPDDDGRVATVGIAPRDGDAADGESTDDRDADDEFDDEDEH
jgi:hypothetical protein